jgi:hypothetical protein
MRLKLGVLVPAILMVLGTVDAITVHVPEDYETIHQALFATSSKDTVIVREYYYRERIPRFDGMPTVICEGWEPEFVDVEPRAPRESRDEVCGDANGDGLCTVSDVVFLSEYFYSGGPAPEPGGDADNDGSITPQDIAYLVDYFYFTGPPPCYYGWQGPSLIHEPNTRGDIGPRVDMDNESNPWVVWMGGEIYLTVWNGSGWESE